MPIPKRKKNKSIRKYLFCIVFLLLGICIGLLITQEFLRENSEGESITVATNPPILRTNALVTKTNAPTSENTDLIVDYPFSYGLEGWQLILHENDMEQEADHTHSEREFRLYNKDGQLVQAFPCILDAEELTFQFDHLFYYYGYDKDLVVFPADAIETGANGFCYPWENETKKFSEYPIEIPWYQKNDHDTAFLTTETKGNIVINTICRINEKSRQVVELRKWTLTGEEQDDKGTLQILDCLTGQNLYFGEVEWNSLGNLVNEKYYQFLFWHNLDNFWNWTNNTEIETTKVTQDNYEKAVYQSREELLADCGFQGKEPFYEYYNSLRRLELELFFDEQTGQGCGILYGYRYNYDLEQVTQHWGFSFDQVTTKIWEPEDTFSTLSIHGDNAKANNVSGYKEIYEYTDDGKLSSFESRGTIVDYTSDPGEDELLSMDYVYRNDGTLYNKQYYHHHILFGSTYGLQSSDYDEQGRIVCKYCYVTTGSHSYYYIYKNDQKAPAYCLILDSYGGPSPEMISYGN